MLEWTKPAPTPVRIAFLLFDQFSNLCLANCLEPLRAANTLSRTPLFGWEIMTPDGQPVLSSSRMQVAPRGALAALEPVDYLFVLASYDHDRHDNVATRRGLRQASGRARATVGLDAAPWLLASAGLLAGKRATVHWDLLEAFTERFLEVEAERSRVVRDGALMTCAGAMSALDMTLDLIADHAGLALRLDIEALFLRGEPPVVSPRDHDTVSDPLVRRALALMREHQERPLSLPDLARVLSCQPRTLDRRCRAVLGAPPGRVYRHLRLSAARKLLEGSALSVAEVALRCGYESPASMARAIKAHYGVSPTGLRRA